MIDINKLNTITKKLLENRGIKTESDIFDFFYQDIYTLSNPFAIKDADEFVSRIKEAINNDEHILVYGDKDADGVTAAAIIYNTLKAVTKNIRAFIPNLETGYGLSKDVISKYASEGVSLIVTVDCGISNLEEVAYARELGIDIIVTDHHDIPEELPDAYMVFNPKIKDSGFVCRSFSGCAVAFKLMQAFVFSYTKFYDRDYVILDFEISKNDGSLLHVKALRVKNFLPASDMFFADKKDGYYTVDDFDEELSEEDVLEELASYMFEGEKTGFVLTGGQERLEKLLTLYKKYEIYIGEFDDVFNLLEMAQKYAGIDFRVNNTLESFALALKLNIYRYKNIPHGQMYLRLLIFRKLFYLSQKKICAYLKKKSILVALGTVADVAEITGENRAFVRSGLAELSSTDNIRYKALIGKTVFGNDGKIDTHTIGWRIAPFINAAGRLGQPEKSFHLLTSEDETDAEDLANYIHELNIKRRNLTDENFKIIERDIKTNGRDEHLIIIAKSSEIEQGFTGLIAGRVLSEYKKTAVILYEGSEGVCIGSIRSKRSDNVRQMLETLKHHLVKFGGHPNAAGFSIESSNYEAFEKDVIEHAKEYSFGKEVQALPYEMLIGFDMIDLSLAEEIAMLEPFGTGNEEPVFSTKNVRVIDIKNVGKNKNKIHAMMNIMESGKVFNSILWDISEEEYNSLSDRNNTFDIIYKIKLNTYKGSTDVKLYIEKFKTNVV